MAIPGFAMQGFDRVEVKKVKVGHTFSSFELPEVDEILHGTKFRNPISFSTNTITITITITMMAPVEVLTSVPHLEILFLTEWFKESVLHMCDERTLPRLFVFNNLKRLVFLAKHGSPNLCQFVYLLEACPLLQKLELDMGISSMRGHKFIEKLTKMASIPGSPHSHLKEIDIYGLEGFPEKVQLSIYLLKKSIVLEKMNIYTATRGYYGNGEWVFFENAVKKKEGRMSLKKVRKLLLKVKSSSTKLIIVSK